MKKAVIYGAGNIGRGFIGQLFSESGYEVAFVDINTELINAINRERRYPVRILGRTDIRDIWVENVAGIHGADEEKVAEAISNADIMATAVGAGALPMIAERVAEGLKKRWQKQNWIALDILVCENLPEAGSTFTRLVRRELDPEYEELFDEKVGIVETSIGRMVPVMTPEMTDGNSLRVCVEEFCDLPVDQNGFRGQIPFIKNMTLYSPFAYILQRKLYIHNMGHAVTAYLGRLKGYEYIADAAEDPVIRQVTVSAMKDLAICLCKQHGTVLEDANSYIDNLLYRFGNRRLQDTVGRVGKDVKRKLSPGDRLVGSARLCIENGMSPALICLGIAAAIRFLLSGGKGMGGCLKTADEILEEICEINRDDQLYSIIIPLYRTLESDIPLENAVCMAGEMLNLDQKQRLLQFQGSGQALQR